MSDATADLLSEFLEISVQQILVSRKVYPPQLFVKCRKYGLPLYQSKHSALAHYLNDLMESVRAFIRRGSLDKFVLSLLLNNQVVERFIFEVRAFTNRIFRNRILHRFRLQIRTPSLPTPISDQSIEAIVQSFRSALVKLISLPCSSHNSSEGLIFVFLFLHFMEESALYARSYFRCKVFFFRLFASRH